MFTSQASCVQTPCTNIKVKKTTSILSSQTGPMRTAVQRAKKSRRERDLDPDSSFNMEHLSDFKQIHSLLETSVSSCAN